MPPRRLWLHLTWPIAAMGVAASVLGLTVDRIYSRETENWTSQSMAQDITNLAVFPALAVLALLALRGSLAAYLGWLGLLVFSAYGATIYAFAVHFGPLFLMYVALLGLSAYALLGGTLALDPDEVKARLAPGARTRLAGRLLVGIGVVFYLLWLSVNVPASIDGEPPEELVDVGLVTNPVHVLDMALLLPALITAGVLLLRARPLGFVLAPVLLVGLAALSVGIAVIAVVADVRDGESGWPLVVVMLVIAALLLVAFRRLVGKGDAWPRSPRRTPPAV